MSALLFTACNKAEVVPPSISKQKPKEIVIWDSNSKSSISQQEYDNAMLAYVKSKYPRKVKAYYKAKAKARKKLIRDNTLMLGNLMWQDNLDSKSFVVRNWWGAKDYCKNLALLGFSDWRLGTKVELKNLYNNKSKLKYFSPYYYWSSTTYDDYKYGAWVVFFGNGFVGYGVKGTNGYVRCVRDGQ